MTNCVVGANQNDKHIINVNIDRDFKATSVVDITLAANDDLCTKCGSKLESKDGIEVGNTFMLGTKYSEALGAKFLDAEGKEHPIIMGSYGIGITRTAQAALERYFDDEGIIWPKAIAPYLVEVIPLNLDIETVKVASERVYSDLVDAGIDVLMDDRGERAGVKFNDADLIGMPLRITIGEKSLKDGNIELKSRADNKVELVSIEDIVEAVNNLSERIN
jgi:prolyl-tRNA synthetase